MVSRSNRYARSVAIRATSSVAIGSLLLVPACVWSQIRSTTTYVHPLPPAAAAQNATTIGRHGPDTNSGRNVSGMSGGKQAGIIGGIVAAGVLTAWGVHHYEHKQPSSEDLLKNGPRVPQNVLMSHLIVDGVIGPGWPVGLDFQLAGPGSVTLDITTADKVQYHQVLTNDLNGRGITITYPDGLPDKVQSATFDVEAAAPAGSNGAAPNLRVYGIAAGPKAVGSIAIDEVTFGPSAVKMKQAAQYGFHSHSDFSDVRADFMFTGLKDNHIVMKQDNETPLSPVTPDEHAQGSLESRGTEGQHLLQIRAWRGNSGDWVVAWSPDVVVLSK
jgi:hypothetical protein